ncbi:MAG: class I SAM-dependent methyltransferase [Planctomycetota bacterium]
MVRAAPGPAAGGAGLNLARLDSHAAFRRYRDEQRDELRRREELERSLLRAGEGGEIEGECYVCGAPARFRVGYEYAAGVGSERIPNWREVLHCRGCGLNNRARAALHLLDVLVAPRPAAAIYLTEQTGPLHARLQARFPGLVASEYLPAGAPPAQGGTGLRHEDLRALSFAPATFDLVLSFDVLEHIPDHRAALRELHRVLRPGGELFLTVPFRPDQHDNLTRAVREEDGTLRHLLPPEIHGDPLRPGDALAFHHFGWQLFDDLRAADFRAAAAHFYWSRRFAYLGAHQRVVVAER